MSASCCTATTRDGRPCAARPLPGSDYCLFHDPARQPALTESRSQGGSTPRRRTRRFPRILDYKHVAEPLGELLIDALNDPAACDPQRLRALTGLSSVLLRAVGRPLDTYWHHPDRTEPAATDDHLLRLYPPDPPELTSLRAADAEIEAHAPRPHEPDPSDPSDPSAFPPGQEHPNTQPPTPEPDYDAMSAETERRFRTPPENIAEWRAAFYASPLSAVPEPDGTQPHPEAPQGWQQEDEQDANRSRTGAPATDPFSLSAAVPSPLADDPEPDTPAERSAGPAAIDTSAGTPSSPASLSPCLTDDPTATSTLSVPGIPILISLRRVPHPFG